MGQRGGSEREGGSNCSEYVWKVYSVYEECVGDTVCTRGVDRGQCRGCIGDAVCGRCRVCIASMCKEHSVQRDVYKGQCVRKHCNVEGTAYAPRCVEGLQCIH